MADHPSSSLLSPQLSTVLSSLNISLEAELNRYRRNRRLDGLAEEDLFTELEDPTFDFDALEQAVEATVAHTATLARPVTPPPVPVNKKLAAHITKDAGNKDAETPLSSALTVSKAKPQSQESSAIQPLSHGASLATSTQVHSPAESQISPSQASGLSEPGTLMPHPEVDSAGGLATTGYLASSEKLIESLADGPPMPDPVDTVAKPKRKTASLLAGATLGSLGLAAGLAASYLMANPLVTQQIASTFQGGEQAATTEPEDTFDPPGPDLSANEFIDLEIDNLSSLKMPQVTVSPGTGTTGPVGDTTQVNPATSNALPPIENQVASSSSTLSGSSASSSTVNPPLNSSAAPTPTLASRPVAPASIETQAVVIPTGLTYYVTAPFTTEQSLIAIRESISEAFVRRFADGDRIQIAAFDNAQAAGAFIEELKSQNITAQIYGPTTE